MTHLPFAAATLLIVLQDIATARGEEGMMAAAAVVPNTRHAQAAAVVLDIRLKHAPNCLPVMVYQQNISYDYSPVVLQTSRTLSGSGSSFLTFTSDEMLLGAKEPSSFVLGAAANSCVFYIFFFPVAVVEEIYLFLSRSEWFIGAPRYFTWLAPATESMENIAASETLMEAHGLVTILPQRSDLYDIIVTCPFCRNGEPELVIETRWSLEQGFTRDVDLFPKHFKNCNGHQFRAVSLDYPPFLDYTKRGEGEPVDHLDSIDVRILDAVAATFNFTYAIYEPSDGQWGFQLPNKSWTGVIGTVERFEADFSLNVLITGQRDEVVDFTIGYHNEPLTFAMGKPKPLPQWLSLVRPFQVLVWGSVGVTIAAVSVVLWLLTHASNKVTSEGESSTRITILKTPGLSRDALEAKDDASSLNDDSYLNALDLTVRGFLRQDMKLPRKSPVQVFMCFWLIAGFVITIGYVSTLTAFLTVPTLSPTVNNLEELSQSHFSWGVQNFKAADYQLFKSSDVPLYQTIFRGLRFCSSLKDCLQQTLDENFAFISWLTYIRDSIAVDFTDRHGDSKIVLARDVFAPGQLGFCLKRNFQLKEYMNTVMRRLMEGGFVQKWLTEFITKHSKEGKALALEADLARVGGDPSRLTASDESTKSLTLYHLQGVFLVYVFCLFVAVVTFLLEFAIHRRLTKTVKLSTPS